MSSLELKIVHYLQKEGEGKPVDTLRIAKACCGRQATKKQVNPTLYALQKLRIVKCVTPPGQGNVKWVFCGEVV